MVMHLVHFNSIFPHVLEDNIVRIFIARIFIKTGKLNHSLD